MRLSHGAWHCCGRGERNKQSSFLAIYRHPTHNPISESGWKTECGLLWYSEQLEQTESKKHPQRGEDEACDIKEASVAIRKEAFVCSPRSEHLSRCKSCTRQERMPELFAGRKRFIDLANDSVLGAPVKQATNDKHGEINDDSHMFLTSLISDNREFNRHSQGGQGNTCVVW